MKLRHILMLVLLCAVWGFNFVPIRVGLNQIPPLTFTLLRFLFTVFPAIFFVKKPDLPYRTLALYGCVMFAGQFGFVFSGLHAGMSVGLASLVMQLQAFFTIGFAAILMRETPRPFQIIGAVVAACGVALVGMHVGGEVTILGLCCVIVAALCWSCGNLITKSFGKIDMLGVIVWGNVFACVPMTALAFAVEGREAMFHGFASLNVSTVLSLAYIAYASTVFGYWVWSYMLSHHPAAMVAPFTLMVPAFAMLSASVFLGETYPLWKFEATCLILCGLALNQFGGKLVVRLNQLMKPTPAPD